VDFFVQTDPGPILALSRVLGALAYGRLGPARRDLNLRLGRRKPQHSSSASGHRRTNPARSRSSPSRAHQRRPPGLPARLASSPLPSRRTSRDPATARRTRLVTPTNRRCLFRHRRHPPLLDAPSGRNRTEVARTTAFVNKFTDFVSYCVQQLHALMSRAGQEDDCRHPCARRFASRCHHRGTLP
jgi:hypothetical protein